MADTQDDRVAHGLLGGLTREDRSRLLSRMRRRRFETGTEIIAYGDRSQDVFFLVAGRATATLMSMEGKLVAYRDIGPGDIFGELAFLTSGPRNASVHARDATTVGALSPAAFEAAIGESPGFAMALSRHLARMVADLTERVFEHSALIVRQRLGRELLRRAAPRPEEPDRAIVEKLPSHAELAAFIGTHREAVTKELSAFARLGLIGRDGAAIEIPSLQSFEAHLASGRDWN